MCYVKSCSIHHYGVKSTLINILLKYPQYVLSCESLVCEWVKLYILLWFCSTNGELDASFSVMTSSVFTASSFQCQKVLVCTRNWFKSNNRNLFLANRMKGQTLWPLAWPLTSVFLPNNSPTCSVLIKLNPWLEVTCSRCTLTQILIPHC